MKDRRRDLLKRIAQQECMGMRAVDIARALGIDEAGLSKIRSSDEYKEIHSQESINPKYQNINNDWDSIEELALQSVKNKLVYEAVGMKVGELMAVANTANKASRRSVPGVADVHMIGQNHGNIVVINLSQESVTRLEKRTVNVNSSIVTGENSFESRPAIEEVKTWSDETNLNDPFNLASFPDLK